MFEEKKKPAALGGEAAGALSLSRVSKKDAKQICRSLGERYLVISA